MSVTLTHLDGQQTLRGSFTDTTSAFKVQPIATLVNAAWDYMSRTVNSATETYVFKTGGSGGTTVCTLTLVYADSTLASLTSVTRS